MSKELIVAGVIIAVCAGVTVLAFQKPSKTEAVPPIELAHNQPAREFAESSPPSSLAPIDSFGRDNQQGPAGTADLNPNRPFDNVGGPGSPTNPGIIPFSGADALPGASSQLPITPPGESLPPTGPTSASGAPSDLIPAPSGEQQHIVKRGDTLSEISKRYYGTTKHWRKIKEANQVDPDGLSEGTKLVIPALPASESPITAVAPAAGDAGTYVVKKNDTYYKIAKAQLGDASRAKEIEKLNNVSAADLRPGMKLALPARGARDSGPAAELTPPTGDRVHTVGKDEYLTDIAKKWYGSTKHWRTIEKANPGIDPDRLKVGQKLVIPEVAGTATSGGTSAPPVAAGEGDYVVVAGDTFEAIAGKVLGDKKQHKRIAEANPGVDSARLRIGQKLKLPAGASETLPPPSETVPTPDPLPFAPLPPPTIPAPPTGSQPLPPVDPWNLGTPRGAGTGAGTGTSPTSANPWSDLGAPTGGTPTR